MINHKAEVNHHTAGLSRYKPIMRVLLVCIDLYSGSILLYLLFRLIKKPRFWIVDAASLVLPWLLLISVPLLILALVKRSRRHILSTGVIATAFIVLYGGLFLPPAPQSERCVPSSDCLPVAVMTINSGAGLADPDSLVTVLRDSGADLIGLQELSIEQADQLEADLASDYPYQALYPLGFEGRGLISRYPIISHTLFYPEKEYLPYLIATVDINSTPLTVIVYHIKPAVFLVQGLKTQLLPEWPTDEAFIGTAQSLAPTVILGDFNTVDQSDKYRQLRQAGFTDAFREAGWGFGLTFPSRADGWRSLPDFPLLRIDYIWVTGDISVSRAWVGDRTGSDHLPVQAELFIRTNRDTD
ncbi:MAG: endonuclease/exonuclease/phosphatase family protein [Anaerolineae bacterium]|nr:endonuclease/exonuclease/phosphatase family protein [Anaerolineae bacterium]